MGYSAKRPHRLFRNEAERQAWADAQLLGWEEAGRAACGRTERFLHRLLVSRGALIDPSETTSTATMDETGNWATAGREAKGRSERFIARLKTDRAAADGN